MNRQQRKRLIKDLVKSRQLPQLVAFAQGDKRVIGALCALLFEQDDRFRWRAIEALGELAAAVLADDRESVRELLRRLEWLMNDESGGSGWHSPEAIAVIVMNVPAMMDDFGLILGSYLNDEPLSRGAHWAVAALSKVRPDLFADKIDELTGSLRSADPYVRGYAVLALASLDRESVAERTQSLENDAGTLDLYCRDSGEMRTTTVEELVKLALTDIDGSDFSIDVW